MLRSWKRSFDSNFNSESPEHPKRVDLNSHQKHWLKRVWYWASVAVLKMDNPCIPDAIPRYNEARGWHYVPALEPQFHHITPVGESVRIDGSNQYNVARNLVPVSARYHVGKGVRKGEEVEDYVIHPDTMTALRNYGASGRESFNVMQSSRRGLTEKGIIYHNPDWDGGLIILAQRVIDAYTTLFPEDTWPKDSIKKPRPVGKLKERV